MPIRDLKCLNCNHEYEVLTLSVKEEEEIEKELQCPRCGSKAKERMISKNTSFQLKGKNWAKDRYGR